MSSQGINSTIFNSAGKVPGSNWFTTSTDNTGVAPRFPLRDGSDYTKLIKERSVYREARTGDPFNGEPSPLYPITQSPAYRLSFRFGRVKCGSCDSGAFPSAS